jgi:hypothetical protein
MTTTTKTPEAAPKPEETPPKETDLFKKPQEHSPATRRISLSNVKEVEYDFESKVRYIYMYIIMMILVLVDGSNGSPTL